MTILAGNQKLITNAQLILNLVELGYIKPDDEVVDVTYGKGKWWTKYHHDHDRFLGLVWNGDYVEGSEYGDPVMRIDHFGKIALPDQFADVVAFDPPYVSLGGRVTSTMIEFNIRYGLNDTPRTPWELHVNNWGGFVECVRICKDNGYILIKTMNYISSGKVQPQAHWVYEMAKAFDCELCEEFHHVGNVRAQPGGRRQVHARSNTSILYVFKKKPRRIG